MMGLNLSWNFCRLEASNHCLSGTQLSMACRGSHRRVLRGLHLQEAGYG